MKKAILTYVLMSLTMVTFIVAGQKKTHSEDYWKGWHEGKSYQYKVDQEQENDGPTDYETEKNLPTGYEQAHDITVDRESNPTNTSKDYWIGFKKGKVDQFESDQKTEEN